MPVRTIQHYLGDNMKDERKIRFKVTGGFYDGQELMIPPPIHWVQKALVFQSPDGDYENYLFSRIDYSAKFLGVVVPNS